MPMVTPSTTEGSGTWKASGLIRSPGVRRALEEDGSQQVVPGQQLQAGTVEADLALFHAVGVVDQVEGDVDRLLDEYDRRPRRVDDPHHAEELVDDHRRQAERQLVDHEEP